MTDLSIKRLEQLGQSRVRLTVEVGQSAIADEQRRAELRYQKAAALPGFRQGKAPLAMIRQRFAAEIEREAMTHIVEHGFLEAVERAKLTPLTKPKIELKRPNVPGSELQFEAEFEIHPEIELKEYKGIPLAMEAPIVTEEEMDRFLNFLREKHATLSPSEATRAAVGQVAKIRVGYEILEEPFKKGEPLPFEVELGKEELLPFLESAVLEMQVGEVREVDGTYPESSPEKDLAGKKTRFQVTLDALQEKVLPPLDDGFATLVREGLTLESMKEEIRSSLLSRKEEDEKYRRRGVILDFLIEKNRFEVPKSMVVRQLADFLKRYKDTQQLEKDHLADLEKQAERSVRGSLLLGRIAEVEKMELQKEVLEKRVAAIAGTLQKTPEETLELLEKSGDMARLQNELLTDQVFDFLMQHAQTK